MSPVPDPSQNHKGNPLDDLSYENHGTGLIGPGSSSEEEDHSGIEIVEYQPLPQGPENLDDDEPTHYSSLSELLAALSSHGPNEISIDTTELSQLDEDNSEAHNCEGNTSISQTPEITLSSTSTAVQNHESERQRNREYRKEQADLWNSGSSPNQIEIDEDKKEVIKLAMAKITLPNSAVPAWAKELSDEEWKTQVYARLFGKNNTEDEQR